MEALLEGHDGHVGSSRGLVIHGRVDFFGGEVCISSPTLLLALPHKSSFVCELVGIRTSLGSKYLIEAFGSDGEDTSLKNVGPVMLGEVSERWAIDNG